MDGITAAEATIGILSALKTTVDAAKLFYQRAGTAGETLQNCYLSFDKCHTALEMWTQFWMLDSGLSRRYQETLWGCDGSRTIGLQLAKIRGQMQDVWDELSPLLNRAGITRETAPQVDWSSADDFRRGSTRAKKLLRMRDRFWFGRGKGDDLLSLITALDASIADLRELSLTRFSQLHGSSWRQQAPSVLASDMGLTTFLNAAVDARMAGRTYFEALSALVRRRGLPLAAKDPESRYPNKAELDLNLVEKRFLTANLFRSKENIQLRYHLSMDSDARLGDWGPLEMAVDGPHKLDRLISESFRPFPTAENSPGIQHAYYAARESSTTPFTVQSGDGTYSAWFRVQPVKKEDKISDSTVPEEVTQKLRHILRPLPSTEVPMEGEAGWDYELDFPMLERIELASRIVLAAFFLFATPWFSKFNIGCDALARYSKLSELGSHYVLDIDMDTDVPAATSFQAATRHLHLLGLFLVEMGIGMPLKRIKNKGALSVREFEFVFEDPRSVEKVAGDSWLKIFLAFLRQFVFGPLLPRADTQKETVIPESSVYSQLRACMGEEYETLVRLVLGGTLWVNVDRENWTAEMLRIYWSEVYTRMESIIKRIELIGESIRMEERRERSKVNRQFPILHVPKTEVEGARFATI
ncbi:hypothetical protein QBC35DRAFT_505210 [Podospora australis]|uniref:Uncharacterized protein n=1 Tax=Podospora australis TaxID=1536484 RepID=A0AAN7AGB6_9PEZI|nr:hypothetical protein QBC35DRAFT_505210 [Podospora australis]